MKIIPPLVLLLCVPVVLPLGLPAQEKAAKVFPLSDTTKSQLDSLTQKYVGNIFRDPDAVQKKQPVSESSLMVFPYMSYTPETDLLFGVVGIWLFSEGSREASPSKPSKILIYGYYTLRKMYTVELNPQLYFDGNKQYINAAAKFSKLVDNFWGVGNNTLDRDSTGYKMTSNVISVEYRNEIEKGLHGGIVVKTAGHDMLDTENNAALASGTVTGSGGGRHFGVGPSLTWDTRDNIFSPLTGGYYHIDATYFIPVRKNVYSFNKYMLDLRHWYSFGSDHVIGGQVYATSVFGDPPFYELSALGGDNHMRGYYLGRYRDRHYFTAQVEYRTHLFWRIGAVGFFGVGDVSDTYRNFRLTQFKYSYGAGLRFALQPEDRLNIRVDFGWGKNDSGVYFQLEEAF